ncbi:MULTISPECIES: 12-oxophytodienoate reductase [Sphingobium]|uniref:oxidoreductase n=1 Tax=Sphingobium TaxID=165695 RepID=UPI00159C1496|nr:12-oxophytodienoate reductase [Sphingobium sp. 15-1]
MSLEKLFAPCTIKGLDLKNRIVMAPMTRYKSPGGILSDEMKAYYGRRARADVGMIISEATGIDRACSLNHPDVPRFHGDAALAAWADAGRDVALAGCVMAPQLWHVGAVNAGQPKGWAPERPYESPSGYLDAKHKNGVAMSEEDIADAVAAYSQAAVAARDAGFPCLELHGAHGYLIDQFFWDVTNRREDAYGSKDLPGRARFAAEVLKAVRQVVGPDYPIILRLSQWKQQDYGAKLAATPEALDKWLTVLMDAGADIFHCSQRRFWEAEFEGSPLNFAGWAKKLTGAPSITVGSIGLHGDMIATITRFESAALASLDELLERLDRDEFDLVAVGRALIQDPLWATKVREGRDSELQPFDAASLASIY